MVTIHPIETIVSDPQIRNGSPVIRGTSIRVMDIVASHVYRNLNAEELAVNFGLEMGQVYAALAHYYDNKSAIDAEIQRHIRHVEDLRAGFAAEQ